MLWGWAPGTLMAVECLELGAGVDGLGDVYRGGRISLSLGTLARTCGGWGVCRAFLGHLGEAMKTLACPCLLQAIHTRGEGLAHP